MRRHHCRPWMLVGFIHGVMNTDNMTISGESIDFGPCAFMDAYDPATVFSSIDHAGRYAYATSRDRPLEPGPPRRGDAPAVRRRARAGGRSSQLACWPRSPRVTSSTGWAACATSSA